MVVYTRANVLRGALLYASGDTAAALILRQFSLPRLLGMALIGATVYALEIPNYFAWIDRRCGERHGLSSAGSRTVLALLYFNPLWIARHLFFIQLFSGAWSEISWGLLSVGARSFGVNIPISLVANYTIQNAIPLRWRFFASATFSALMAVYYALSITWFG